MPERYPFHYELEPKSIEKGAHWLVLTLRNRGDTVLKDINVNLSSRDTANLTVATSGEYIGELVPGEEETLPLQGLCQQNYKGVCNSHC